MRYDEFISHFLFLYSYTTKIRWIRSHLTPSIQKKEFLWGIPINRKTPSTIQTNKDISTRSK